MGKLLRGRIVLICAGIGAGIAALMIITHTGPGIKPLPKADSPQARNEIRRIMLDQLADAFSNYWRDHGRWPITAPTTETNICTNYGANCKSVGLVDLNILVTEGSYVNNISCDRLGGSGRWNTGYSIVQLPNGRIKFSAPRAEAGATISVVR